MGQKRRRSNLSDQEKAVSCVVKEYAGEILMVGIYYDKKTKEHVCKIELLEKK